MSKKLLFFNGIDGDTGGYDRPPISPEDLVEAIRGEDKPENLAELRFRTEREKTGFLGVKDGVDPTKLEESGWGVIFPAYRAAEKEREKEVDAIREALQPLLKLRQEQAGERFAEWSQGTDKGFRVGRDTKSGYLARHGAGPGPADPDQVPYYLLIAGSPADIPYRFQSQLDVQYAVGRIHFPTLDEYAAYAANVVAVETSPKRLPRRATFFGAANPDDPATLLSATKLIKPLADKMRSGHADWTVEACVPQDATKAALASLLGGDQTPSLLFTASHGMKFAKNSPRQLAHQGALLCQDWPGPQQWTQEIPQDFYFAADDLAGNADLLGLVAFFFACYGGGTPQFNEFALFDRPGATRPRRDEIAPHPFLAQLPVRMLGQPRGALAVVGHVERAWSYSFDWGQAGTQTTAFESMVERLLNGHPIGSAIEYLNERYAELSTVLSDALEEGDWSGSFDPFEMAGMWTANNDARGYAILGDPAVRLPVAQGTEAVTERPAIEVVVPSIAPAVAAAFTAAASPAAAGPAVVNRTPHTTPAPADAFQAMLQQTEARFSGRSEEREETRAKIEAGKILEADSAERVIKRLEHLKVDPGTAYALTTGGTSFAPIAGPRSGEPSPLERVLGTSDLMGISFLELGLRISRTVGRVHCRNRIGQLVGFGTGFMVSPRLMMTNHHVLDSSELASFSQVEFDYQIGLDGKPAVSMFFSLAPDEFFLTDVDLDYTLVAVQPQLPDGRRPADFGWNRLLDQEGKIIKGEYVNIVQHPNGEPKQLALRENQLEDVLDAWLHYRTDTAPGSSGSPVFNDQWEVVALHHSGVPRRDAEGNILTRDGQLWQPIMGEHRIDWLANEGARVSRIVKHIKTQPLSAAAASLRDEMFAKDPMAEVRSQMLGPGPMKPVSPSAATVPGSVSGPVVTVPGPGAGADQGMTWTIPIEVTVRLGQPVGKQPEGAPQPVVVAKTGLGAVPPAAQPQVDPDLAEALAELAAAPTRVYYDAAQDACDREAYYAGIDPSLDPGGLFQQLSGLLTSSHTTKPSYKPSKLLYPWVDLHPDLKLRSIYSGLTFDAETLIREDLAVDQERARRTQELLARESARDVGVLLRALDLLEAELPYNCEHSVPQSWFGKQEPMRGDLHHLFACESRCNSFRGNHGYFDFTDFEEAIRDDCGKREENRFEPSSLRGKGVVARATLYFLLRYPGLVDAAGGELDAGRLPVLLAWHRASPPDEYERHRNMAIFAMQGNRNPLVDFPEWADKIDFLPGFGA